jgi:hypothetical protein
MSTKSSAKSSHSSLRSTLSTSSISSTVRSGAKAVKRGVKRVKKGASAIIRPFKHSKHALSNVSTPAVSDVKDGPAVDEEQGSVKSYASSEVIEVDSDSEELNNLENLEKELGAHSFHLLLTISLISIISGSTEILEVPCLLILQKQCNDRGTSRLCCSTSLPALRSNAGVRQEGSDVIKTRLTSRRPPTSGIMQLAAGVRMLSTRLQRERLVSAEVVISSVVLLGKDKIPSHTLTVHTLPPSFGEHNSCDTFIWLMYTSAHIAKWVAESNCPATVVSDPELINLLTTGHPHLKVPSPNTVRRDIKAAYERCRQHITKLLREHPGHVHFATDAWTSTNHHAFVTWTVHLEYNGAMLAFLLDIIEVPESHTGVALAKAFQQMLKTFGLQDRVRS